MPVFKHFLIRFNLGFWIVTRMNKKPETEKFSGCRGRGGKNNAHGFIKIYTSGISFRYLF